MTQNSQNNLNANSAFAPLHMFLLHLYSISYTSNTLRSFDKIPFKPFVEEHLVELLSGVSPKEYERFLTKVQGAFVTESFRKVAD